MPIYGFTCQKKGCGHRFEYLTISTKEEVPKQKCPECGSAKVQRDLNLGICVTFKDPTGSYREEDWDYKHAWNLEMAQRQRQIAEKRFGKDYEMPADQLDLNDPHNYDEQK